MDINIAITFERAGRDFTFGAAVCESFMRADPSWDPLVTQDADDDRLLVELTITATSIVEANLRLADVLRALANELEASVPMTGVRIDAAGRELAVAWRHALRQQDAQARVVPPFLAARETQLI